MSINYVLTFRASSKIAVRCLARAIVVVLQDICTMLNKVGTVALTKWLRLAVLPFEGRA